MSVDDNKALVRRCFDSWNERDSEAALATYSPDYVYHGPPGVIRGRDGISGLWTVFLTGFPDLRATVDQMVGEKDRVVARWTAKGTHTGDFQGIPPSGKSITVHVLEEFRIEDGVLAEAWETFDQLGLLQLIGAVPGSA